MEYLFAYDTLQVLSIQQDLFGRELIGENDAINGYRLGRITDCEMNDEGEVETTWSPALIEDASQTEPVSGNLYTLTIEELLIADKYEGEEYKRVTLPLASGRNVGSYIASKH